MKQRGGGGVTLVHRTSPARTLISSPVGSLCHTRGVVHRPLSVVRRVSSVSTITTRNN